MCETSSWQSSGATTRATGDRAPRRPGDVTSNAYADTPRSASRATTAASCARGVEPESAGRASRRRLEAASRKAASARLLVVARRRACGRRRSGPASGVGSGASTAPGRLEAEPAIDAEALGERLEPCLARGRGGAGSDRERGARARRAVHDGDRDRNAEKAAAVDDAVAQTRRGEERLVERGRAPGVRTSRAAGARAARSRRASRRHARRARAGRRARPPRGRARRRVRCSSSTRSASPAPGGPR